MWSAGPSRLDDNPTSNPRARTQSPNSNLVGSLERAVRRRGTGYLLLRNWNATCNKRKGFGVPDVAMESGNVSIEALGVLKMPRFRLFVAAFAFFSMGAQA